MCKIYKSYLKYKMFFTHVIVGNYILEYNNFQTLGDAERYANEKCREKVWNLGNGAVYFGDAEVHVYNPLALESSDYKDVPLKVFT